MPSKTDLLREEFEKLIKAESDRIMIKLTRKPDPGPELPPKWESLRALMNTHGHHMGCQEPTVRRMLEILVDAPEGTFKAPPKKAGTIYQLAPTFTMVVPVSNPNSHSYPIGEPCMMIEQPHALKMDGYPGNLLPLDRADIEKGEILRYATPEEQEKFWTAISGKIVATQLLKLVEKYRLEIPVSERETPEDKE